MEITTPSPSSISSISVEILTPALLYPTTLSRQEIYANSLRDLALSSEECKFYDIDNERVACVLKNNKFNMEWVERMYHQNVNLTNQLQRAVEALATLNDRTEKDQTIINSLKTQIEELTSSLSSPNSSSSSGNNSDSSSNNYVSGGDAWKARYEEEVATRRNLQEKLRRLKNITSPIVEEGGDGQEEAGEEGGGVAVKTPPKQQLPTSVQIPKLALHLASKGITPIQTRSRSSSELLEDRLTLLPHEQQSQQPHDANHPPQMIVNSPPSHVADDRYGGLKRRNTIAIISKPPSSPEAAAPAVDLSMSQDSLSQCRLCNCELFRHTPKAGWICVCGHTSIKHSKISPRAASPRSPHS